MEQISSAESADFDCYKVYYSILDSNQHGETPEKTKKNHSTLLDVVVLTNNKVTACMDSESMSNILILCQDVITHSSIRLLLRSKWQRYVRITLLYVYLNKN